MKRSTRKLVVRRETLRALANIELTRAVGGVDAALQADSGVGESCPIAVNVAAAPLLKA